MSTRRALVVPDEFRETLRHLRKHRDPRLPMLLKTAKLNGWPLRALGEAIGLSREWVRLEILAAKAVAGAPMPDVPLPPVRTKVTPKPPRRRLRINEALAQRLRAMADTAATVNGATPADAPARRVSEEYSAALAALVAQGVSPYELSKRIGVRPYAIMTRLERHGYRHAPPSRVNFAPYKGLPKGSSGAPS